MVKYNSNILLIVVIVLAVLFSGCTGGQDVSSVVKALPEVQQFMKEHPNAQITVTYWSKEEIANSSQDISQQCGKPITPVAMYKAIVSDGDLKIVSWINADNQIVVCSITQGSGSISNQPTPTIEPTSTIQLPIISSRKQAPQASIILSSASTATSTITLTHNGGDSVDLSKTKAIIDEGSNHEVINQLSTTTKFFTSGDNLIINTNNNRIYLNGVDITANIGTATGNFAFGGFATVTLIDLASNQQIAKVTGGEPPQ